MKTKNNYLGNNEIIELSNFIKILIEKKFFILFFSISTMILFYFLQFFSATQYKVFITIREPNWQIFQQYETIYNYKKNYNTININQLNPGEKKTNIPSTVEEYLSDFNTNLLSIDNMINFAQQTKSFKNSPELMIANNDAVKKYFQSNRLEQLKDKNLPIANKYSFKFTNELEGENFINHYVEFIKDKTVAEFYSKLKLTIENYINEIDLALEISKVIDLENPILKTSTQGFQVVNESEPLFYRGSKVLTQQKDQLKKLLLRTGPSSFNYNPLLDRASSPMDLRKSKILMSLVGFLFGFILSIVIIFIKKLSK